MFKSQWKRDCGESTVGKVFSVKGWGREAFLFQLFVLLKNKFEVKKWRMGFWSQRWFFCECWWWWSCNTHFINIHLNFRGWKKTYGFLHYPESFFEGCETLEENEWRVFFTFNLKLVLRIFRFIQRRNFLIHLANYFAFVLLSLTVPFNSFLLSPVKSYFEG